MDEDAGRVRVTGIVLAAGSATRFGATKQTALARGKPLIQHAVDALAEAGVDRLVVVLGHEAETVRASVHVPSNGSIVVNERYAEGVSTTLAAGLRAAAPNSDAAIVLLADQPGVRAHHVRALEDGFAETRAKIVRLRFRDGPGPALLAREVWGEATGLSGDRGASQLIERHPDWVAEVRLDEDLPADVDTPEDLERL